MTTINYKSDETLGALYDRLDPVSRYESREGCERLEVDDLPYSLRYDEDGKPLKGNLLPDLFFMAAETVDVEYTRWDKLFHDIWFWNDGRDAVMIERMPNALGEEVSEALDMGFCVGVGQDGVYRLTSETVDFWLVFISGPPVPRHCLEKLPDDHVLREDYGWNQKILDAYSLYSEGRHYLDHAGKPDVDRLETYYKNQTIYDILNILNKGKLKEYKSLAARVANCKLREMKNLEVQYLIKMDGAFARRSIGELDAGRWLTDNSWKIAFHNAILNMAQTPVLSDMEALTAFGKDKPFFDDSDLAHLYVALVRRLRTDEIEGYRSAILDLPDAYIEAKSEFTLRLLAEAK